jgi:hypothetical protein
MTIKEGDRLAVVDRIDGEIRSAFIYTVARVSANTGWLDNGETFKLSDLFLRTEKRFVNFKLEPVTPEIEEANDRRIENIKEEIALHTQLSRLRNLVHELDRTNCKDLSPEAVIRIAEAIEKELP